MSEPSITEFLTQRWDEQERKLELVRKSHGAVSGSLKLFVAEFGPAYVLADIAAKRRLLEMHTLDCGVGAGPDGDDDYFCDGCPCGSVHSSFPDEVVCQTHRVLAAPFSSHADFRPEWSVSE